MRTLAAMVLFGRASKILPNKPIEPTVVRGTWAAEERKPEQPTRRSQRRLMGGVRRIGRDTML